MASHTWKCQKVAGGVKCGRQNPSRKRLCEGCGKKRPPRKKPAHMAALDVSYEQYVTLNGGEQCGICGELPKPNRRLNRDHEHVGNGKPRGLLCPKCNRFLVQSRYGLVVTAQWLRAAATYLERANDVDQT